MSCKRPVRAYRDKFGGITFKEKEGEYEIKLPCGKCVDCRLNYSREWATRIMDEAHMHDENCFLTLTYDNEHLNDAYSLEKRDFTLFMKRLRKGLKDEKVRYFACGEYGRRRDRPHFHCCLFGEDFKDDRENIGKSKSGFDIYKSAKLGKWWVHGYSYVQDLKWENAAYCAKYICKKQFGGGVSYNGRDKEYAVMSRNPGLGRKYFDRYIDDIYNFDRCVRPGGVLCMPPRYYDELLRRKDEGRWKRIKLRREELTKERTKAENERLLKVHEVKFNQKQRSYENG